MARTSGDEAARRAMVAARARQAGLGLIIVAIIPAAFAVLAFVHDDMGLLSTMKINGLVAAAVLVALGAATLARIWIAPMLGALVCIAAAGALAYAALSKDKLQGLILAGALFAAAPVLFRVGRDLRAVRTLPS